MIEVVKFEVGILGTNCYLIYSKESKTGFLIDPGSFDKKILQFIKKEGLSIESIINTHGHIDHTAGNGKFGYPVLIHERDNEFLKEPTKNFSLFTGIVAVSPDPARLLKDGDIIEKNDIAFEVMHTPGHTPGGISLKIAEVHKGKKKFLKKVFTGDTLFRENVGRTDMDYANEVDLFKSIKNSLMVLNDDTEVLPGHGPNSTIGYERKNNPFLGEI